MNPSKSHPVQTSRSNTDKSLKGERHKTDDVINSTNENIEYQADEKTRINRAASDKNLAQERASFDIEQKGSADRDLVKKRKQFDKEQVVERLEEDRIRNKERFQKRLVAEALLESERHETDENLFEERGQTDSATSEAKTELVTRDQFLAVVSHDLKNPLSSISMGANLIRAALSENGTKEELLQLLEIVERNAAMMDRMIGDLLDVERMSNNKLFLNIENNNIGDLLKECADLFKPVLAQKSANIVLEPLSEEIFAEIDHDKILQVLSNLIGNALKFTQKNGVITLSAHKLNNQVEIAVSDNGPGIPADQLTQIFERFSQLKSKDRRGLGLGLFISKWIVEAHKGRIWVESRVGEGSKFAFTLPVV